MIASPSVVSGVGSHSSNKTSLHRIPSSDLDINTWIFSMHRCLALDFMWVLGYETLPAIHKVQKLDQVIHCMLGKVVKLLLCAVRYVVPEA